MSTKPLPRILLIEDPDSGDPGLVAALEADALHVILADSAADPAEIASLKDADLILVDARNSRERLEPLLAGNPASGNPAFLALVSPDTAEGSRPDGEVLASPGDTGAVIAHIRRHLRLCELERENRELREKLDEIRPHASIGSLADSVAHNLNNVLGIVFGYMHLIKRHHDKPDSVLKHHAGLEKAVNKLTEMVRRFGETARESHAEPEPAGVGEILRRSVKRFRLELDIERDFPFTVEPADLTMNTRANEAEDALVGLLKNAWESYGERPAAERSIEIRADADAEHVRIRIRDHGGGLDEEIVPVMFEPFTSTRNADGLGLPVARRCFRNLGGDLFISEPEDGGVLVEIRHPR